MRPQLTLVNGCEDNDEMDKSKVLAQESVMEHDVNGRPSLLLTNVNVVLDDGR